MIENSRNFPEVSNALAKSLCSPGNYKWWRSSARKAEWGIIYEKSQWQSIEVVQG